MSVGVLALQGCIGPHLSILKQLGCDAKKVRTSSELDQISHLIIPGGESTTMVRLLERENMWEALKEFGRHHPVWGICAGAILIAQDVVNPSQKSLGLMDIQATRNYYGSQRESFRAKIQIPSLEFNAAVDFIRAPLLTALSDKVEVLAKLEDQPVLFRQGHLLASSFHVELDQEMSLHRYFISG